MNKQFIRITLKEYLKLIQLGNFGKNMPESAHIVILSTNNLNDKLQYELIASYEGNTETLSCNNTLLEKFLVNKVEQALFNCLSKIAFLQYKNDREVEENNISELWNNREDAIRKLKDKCFEFHKILHSIDFSNNGFAVV